MPNDYSANPKFSVETKFIGRERQPLLIVDDYLARPEDLVNFAATEARFKTSPTMYPGVVAQVPDEYVDALVAALVPLISTTFGVKGESVYLADSFFAIVTLPPEQLHFRQRLPHVDEQDASQIAVLHYLCDSSQGGTGFYRHRATGFESLNKEQSQQFEALNVKDLAAHGPIPAKYINATDRLFEQTAAFDAKFNRLLIYRGHILHSGMIDANTKLSPDPRVGGLP